MRIKKKKESKNLLSYIYQGYKSKLESLLLPEEEIVYLCSSDNKVGAYKDSQAIDVSGNIKARHLIGNLGVVTIPSAYTNIIQSAIDVFKELEYVYLEIDIESFLSHESEWGKLVNSFSFLTIDLHIELGAGISSVALYRQREALINRLAITLAHSPILQRSCFFTVTITPDNCYFADDIAMQLNGDLREKTTFVPSDDFFIANASYIVPHEMIFHVAMFFDNIARATSLSLSKRFFYKRVVRHLDSYGSTSKSKLSLRSARLFSLQNYNVIVSSDANSINEVVAKNKFRNSSLLLMFQKLSPDVAELNTLGLGLINGKMNHYLKKKKDEAINISRPTMPSKKHPADWTRVLITGWYGTETAGDKAILGEVLHFIKSCSPNCKITLVTICSRISWQTNQELNDLANVELVDIAKSYNPVLINSIDAVIMGGGPLMETSEMVHVLRAFEEANRQEKARIVFGCGLGPFHTHNMKRITTRILALTTAGFFRDEESHMLATKMHPGHVLKFACDPAVGFIYRWKKNNNAIVDKKNADSLTIASLVRANTGEFSAGTSVKELEKNNDDAACRIASFAEPVCKSFNAILDLLHMNAHWIGGDDRLFNRQIEKCLDNKSFANTERQYLPLDTHIQRMMQSDVAIAMRYHGHIFCIALGIPFLSIDYTGKKGKVNSLIKRIGYDMWSEEWSGMDKDRALSRLTELIKNKEHWSEYLKNEAEKLVVKLYQTYTEVFNVSLKP